MLYIAAFCQNLLDDAWIPCSTFEAELADVIPVVKTSIAGTRIIGRLCVGEFCDCLSLRRLIIYLHVANWVLFLLIREQEWASLAS